MMQNQHQKTKRKKIRPEKAIRLNFRYFGLILLFLVYHPGFADTLDEARSLENTGDVKGASVLYGVWLESSVGGAGYADVLQHAALLSRNPLEAIQLISSSMNKVDVRDSYNLYAMMAAMESSLGLLAESAEHYRLASAKTGIDGEKWKLEELTLRFLMGEYSEVITEAMILSKAAAVPRIREDSLSLAAICMSRESRTSEALQILDEYLDGHNVLQSPLPLFAMREIAASDGKPGMAGKARNRLTESFPGSAVQYLVSARVLEWFSPALFFEESGTISGNPVQVAAFGSRERSASLRTRLQYDGFTAWFEQHGDIWKVFVNDPDGTVLSRLKSAGYGSLF